ncbi:MAG: hypothetical protein K6F77_10425 [Lachnospiraceae bacterium]|nr:hypothetical protein [Lachnospiraceae bacterium]
MEILSTIKMTKDVIEIAKPVIETIAVKLQGTMKEFANRMLVLSEKYPSIERFAEMIDAAAEILGDVLYVLGVESDPSAIMGMKVAQAEKSVSDFESTDEYIKYLKNEINVDMSKFESLSDAEKLAYSITGMSVGADAIREKIGMAIPADFVEVLSKIVKIEDLSPTASEVVSLIKAIKDAGITNLNNVVDALKGTGVSDRVGTLDKLKDAMEIVWPTRGVDILDKVMIRTRED